MEKLTEDQINDITNWLNMWDQLRNTEIPARFREQYLKTPLFYDSLGYHVFYGDEYFVVSSKFNISPFRAYFIHNYEQYCGSVVFKTIEDAEKYVENNKVKVIDLFRLISKGNDITGKESHQYILTLSKQIEGKSNTAAKAAIEKALNKL